MADASHALEQFVVPNPKDEEIVFLSDAHYTSAVMASKSNTVVLSSEAARILHHGFLGAEDTAAGHVRPTRLREITSAAANRPEPAEWLRDSAADEIFGLSADAPQIRIHSRSRVAEGSKIPATVVKGGGVPVEYAGTLVEATVNKTRVFWYTASVRLDEKHHVPRHETAAAVSTSGPIWGSSLYPKATQGMVGVHCGRCGLCGVCGACGTCGLCGGVDFAAALVAVDAIIATVAAVNAAQVFGALRE